LNDCREFTLKNRRSIGTSIIFQRRNQKDYTHRDEFQRDQQNIGNFFTLCNLTTKSFAKDFIKTREDIEIHDQEYIIIFNKNIIQFHSNSFSHLTNI
jgi:hypothetical protein